VVIRRAFPHDREALRAMQALAMRVLGAGFYSGRQIEGMLAHLGTMDDFLLEDGTYHVAEAADGAIVASGGWSRRTPGYASGFGAAGREPAPAMPTIRSVFVHPDWTRRGLARCLVGRAKAEARAAGHREIALMATLSGEPLYRKLGYRATDRPALKLPGGVAVTAVRMRKSLEA
jgi:predicted N-acetyltransferase YhbS